MVDELLVFFKDHRSTGTHDLIQTCATEILSKLSTFPDDPAAFRKRVLEFSGMRAKAVCRDRRRDRVRIVLRRSPDDTEGESPSTIMALLLEAERRELAIQHAERLEPIYRTAFFHVLDGGDYRSLAVAENLPLGTAWRRVDKATELVQRSLELNRRTRPQYRTPAGA